MRLPDGLRSDAPQSLRLPAPLPLLLACACSALPHLMPGMVHHCAADAACLGKEADRAWTGKLASLMRASAKPSKPLQLSFTRSGTSQCCQD